MSWLENSGRLKYKQLNLQKEEKVSFFSEVNAKEKILY